MKYNNFYPLNKLNEILFRNDKSINWKNLDSIVEMTIISGFVGSTINANYSELGAVIGTGLGAFIGYLESKSKI